MRNYKNTQRNCFAEMCKEKEIDQITPEYLPISKLEARFGIPSHYIRKMIKFGEVEYCKPGNKTFYVNLKSFKRALQGKT